ncbi:hypothetical protein ACO0K0_07130 [Undibacterium sp. SXout11W]|uniref:hypothetical protein n=1 Tax=Undibacterium sp. SXout11W TaxID=3413050 RepID=UPI003BEFCAAF
MSDILSQLKASGTSLRTVVIDGITVGLRILNDQDYLDADLAMLAFMKKMNVTFATESSETYEHEKSTQLLFRALVDPESGVRIAKTVTEIRDAISRDQKAYLISQYLEHERQCAPREETMPEEEFSALFESVKKKPEMMSLSDLSTETLKRLILSLANPPASSPKESGSTS